MGRGKVATKRIENPVHRQVTFCKRRGGLMKKANELSVMCDVDVGLVIFSANGKLYELATKGDVQALIHKYIHYNQQISTQDPKEKEEARLLKSETEILQKGLRFISGGEADTLNFDELSILEKKLETWIAQVRSAKMEMMLQEIQLLENKV